MPNKLWELLTNKETAAFGAVCAVVGSLGTFFISDYTDFRNSRREVIKEQIGKSTEAQKDLLNSLAKLSAKARDKGSVSTEDMDKFKENIREAYSAANALAVDIPKLDTDFKAYGAALINMQRNAEAFKSSTSAKDFVEAVSEYAHTKDNFNKRASSYLSSWA